ncbi:hypothetical protein [Konateibacter massiliensis]|uniref:hypothetical protein n=1 Tax=Konateibacter massiliensis TaxID=2002841 RepID=UPI00117B2B26|nr:hypothetical protein [Konateibacter massiliensis]
MFCNAPFIDKLYVSVVLRSGRVAWGLGQTLYIVFASFLYTIFVFISSIAVILPRVTVQLQWGKVIGTLALTDAAYQVPLLIFPWKVISNYNPLEATIWAMLLVWLTNTLIGLLLFCFNSIFSRRIGVCVCCGLILIDPVINMTEKTELLRFSPISWSSIENLATNKMSSMLEPMEATVVLLIICTILACVTIGYHRRKPLEKIGIKE